MSSHENLDDFQNNEWIEARVSHIYSLNDFWVQRNDKRALLGNLEEKMT